MKYLDLIKESNQELQERYELVAERVNEIAQDAKETGKYEDYFQIYGLVPDGVADHPFRLSFAGIPRFKKSYLGFHAFLAFLTVIVRTEGVDFVYKVFLSPGQRIRQFVEIEIVAPVILLKVSCKYEARPFHD